MDGWFDEALLDLGICEGSLGRLCDHGGNRPMNAILQVYAWGKFFDQCLASMNLMGVQKLFFQDDVFCYTGHNVWNSGTQLYQ
ncbi:hypothetical protein M6B38_312790 [Iris pallida]|uniref:Reverse transcriptase n=1 Tax=Iris pallida TaxID=29817 RepID=A0AAX6HHA9_IRIPA|nr:hypothetical protein M6B38_312790 [Iris pallida]